MLKNNTMVELQDKEYLFILGSGGNKDVRIKQLEAFNINTENITNHEGYTLLNPVKRTVIKTKLTFYETKKIEHITCKILSKFYNNSNNFKLW